MNFTDNFVPTGPGKVTNDPKLIADWDSVRTYFDEHYQFEVMADGRVYKRSVNYTPTSPYGWELVTPEAHHASV